MLLHCIDLPQRVIPLYQVLVLIIDASQSEVKVSVFNACPWLFGCRDFVWLCFESPSGTKQASRSLSLSLSRVSIHKNTDSLSDQLVSCLLGICELVNKASCGKCVDSAPCCVITKQLSPTTTSGLCFT